MDWLLRSTDHITIRSGQSNNVEQNLIAVGHDWLGENKSKPIEKCLCPSRIPSRRPSATQAAPTASENSSGLDFTEPSACSPTKPRKTRRSSTKSVQSDPEELNRKSNMQLNRTDKANEYQVMKESTCSKPGSLAKHDSCSSDRAHQATNSDRALSHHDCESEDDLEEVRRVQVSCTFHHFSVNAKNLLCCSEIVSQNALSSELCGRVACNQLSHSCFVFWRCQATKTIPYPSVSSLGSPVWVQTNIRSV